MVDFVYPGLLGTLPVFLTELSQPIVMGSYRNASTAAAQTAVRCACVLRDAIRPHLLRRSKDSVMAQIALPERNEQVWRGGD